MDYGNQDIFFFLDLVIKIYLSVAYFIYLFIMWAYL